MLNLRGEEIIVISIILLLRHSPKPRDLVLGYSMDTQTQGFRDRIKHGYTGSGI